jgi:HAMP domain-containing protein
MALSLAVVLSVAGVVLFGAARTLASAVLERTITETAKLSAPSALNEIERQKLAAEREVLQSLEQRIDVDKMQAAIDFRGRPTELEAVNAYQAELQSQLRKQRETRERKIGEKGSAIDWHITSDMATHVGQSALEYAPMEYGPERKPGLAYTWKEEGRPAWNILVPGLENIGERSLLYLIVAITLAVMVVGAAVSWWVANQVAKPIELLLEDVQQIATGDLDHRTHAKTTGEVGALSRAIDRMTRKLAEARGTQVELQVRQSELAVAGEVREQLLPQATPKIAGYSLGHLHVGSAELGGDFHDFIEIGDGRVGLLVCEVNGKGVPAALVGATARSYLRAELAAGGDVKAALLKVNRQLVRDMRLEHHVACCRSGRGGQASRSRPCSRGSIRPKESRPWRAPGTRSR